MKLALAVALVLVFRSASGDVATEYTQDVRVVPLLKTTTTSTGQAIEFPKDVEVTALEVEIAPGKETGWHQHPVPGYAYILSGSVVIEVEGGETRRFDAGDAFVEVINTAHNGKNPGSEPVRILVFFSGEPGRPFTVRTAR